MRAETSMVPPLQPVLRPCIDPTRGFTIDLCSATLALHFSFSTSIERIQPISHRVILQLGDLTPRVPYPPTCRSRVPQPINIGVGLLPPYRVTALSLGSTHSERSSTDRSF